MVMPEQDDLIYLNGINGAGAGYLVEPFTLGPVARPGAQARQRGTLQQR